MVDVADSIAPQLASQGANIASKMGTDIQKRLKVCTWKRPIWEEISVFVRAEGYKDRDHAQCQTRMKTLISAYQHFIENQSNALDAWQWRKYIWLAIHDGAITLGVSLHEDMRKPWGGGG